MFAKITNVGFAQRVVATLVACALVLLSLGIYATAQAANLTDVSNTLTDSDLSVTSGHDIRFTIPTGGSVGPGDTVTLSFPAGFTGVAGSVTGNLTVTVDAVPAAHGSFVSAGQDITFDNITAAAGQEVRVVIVDAVITNPGVAGSYEFVLDSGNGDTGRTIVAIIDNVLVSAIVQTTFDFVIDGTATSTPINGGATTGSTTPTAINFATLVAGIPEIMAQDLQVSTNARNGFAVTVHSDGDLQSSTGAIIDNFVDGSDEDDTGTVWVSPTNDVGDETTWGHWGLTTDDGDVFSNHAGSAYTANFGAGEYIAASTSPRVVFHHDGPADGVTTNIGTTTVGYQIEITALQEAADDYSTTLTYIATPTF